MLSLTMFRWFLGRMLHDGLAWVLLLAFLSLGPLLTVLSPLAATSSPGGPPGMSWAPEVACLALLASHALGVSFLCQTRQVLAREPLHRLLAEGTVLCASAGLFLLAALALLLTSKAGLSLLFDLAPVLLLAHMHLMGLSLVLLRLPFSGAQTSVGLLLLAWLLPALLPAAPFFRTLAIGPWLASSAGPSFSPAATPLPLLLPLGMWALALFLLRGRSGESP